MIPALESFVRDRRPCNPLDIVFPARLTENARTLLAQFGGRVLYAVKCNPSPPVLHALWQGGVRHFDAASIEEIAMLRQHFPESGIHFMHPVKSRESIGRAAREFGVSTFAVDSMDELDKVLQEAGDRLLDIVVRLALPFGRAGRDQSGKFGVAADEAAQVLRRARPLAVTLGLTFHVGSQCLTPQSYGDALQLAARAESLSGVTVDLWDVGGGFPAAYDGCTPPAFADFAACVEQAGSGKQLWCEPGRALVATGAALVAKVIGRKGDAVFLNDGIYGGLAEEPLAGYRYPTTLITADGRPQSLRERPFAVFGPTCDSHDRLSGAYAFPDNLAEGDWVLFENTGAYAGALRSRFNGMGAADQVIWTG